MLIDYGESSLHMDDLKALERKELLNQELARYIGLLIEHDDPERIIVFGSLATGDIHSWSDIDLVIVKQTNLPFLKRLHEMRRLLRPRVGTDILVYTPEEFHNMQEGNFLRKALQDGQVIYEK